MKLVACAAIAAALVVTACGVEQSKLDSKAQVTVTGKVLAASGQCPVAAGSDLSSLQEASTAVGEYRGLAPARSARYVRVMGSSASLLRQISAW